MRHNVRGTMIIVLIGCISLLGLISCGSGDHREPSLSLTLEKITTIPPAGVQVVFSVLKDDGSPVERLEEQDFEVVNSETGKSFGSEGGTKPFLGMPTDFSFYTILVLDMSDSIFRNGAEESVIRGAKNLLNIIKSQMDSGRHFVAIYAFGSTVNSELWADFTADYSVLNSRLDSLKIAGSRGGTNLYGAYIKGMDMVRNKGKDQDLITRSLIILTDGTHEAGNSSVLRKQALESLSKGDVMAYSIGVKGDFNEGVIRELASTPQNFFLVESASEFEEVFNRISERVLGLSNKNYVFGICSPVEYGKPFLTIAAYKNGISGSLKVPYDISISGWTGDVSKCSPPAIAIPPVTLP